MRVDEIKSVSLKLFALHGYEGTYLSTIAEDVGIRKSSIYYYFKTKEDLFLSVFEDILNKEIEDIKKVIKEVETYSVNEKLYRIFQYYCVKFETSKDEMNIVYRAMLFSPVSLSEKLKNKFANYEKILDKILTPILKEGIENEIIKSNDIKDILVSFYCLIDGLFVQLHCYSRQKYKSYANSLWNTFWNGITNTD